MGITGGDPRPYSVSVVVVQLVANYRSCARAWSPQTLPGKLTQMVIITDYSRVVEGEL